MSDTSTPQSAAEGTGAPRAARKVREGLVVSTSMDKTIVVAVVERVRHPRYAKTVQRTSRLYAHCEADDVKVGKWTSFPQAVKLKPGEVVVFSYIVYKNRAARDKINKKVMEDPRLNTMMAGKDMPFDGKRMIYGGFDTIVSLDA